MGNLSTYILDHTEATLIPVEPLYLIDRSMGRNNTALASPGAHIVNALVIIILGYSQPPHTPHNVYVTMA